MKKRLDVYLCEHNLVASRTKAQDLIKAGAVVVNGKTVDSVKLQVGSGDKIEILKSDETKYVSRGGLKLEGALKHLNLEVKNLNVIDVGISTGGFSDCLLQAGVNSVLGVDVGQKQLHSSLQNNPSLTLLEKINARELHQLPHVLRHKPLAGWDLAVIDVSFISLSLVLPAVFPVICERGYVLALVKPQFEVGAAGLNKQGIVKDDSAYGKIERSLVALAISIGFEVKDYFPSSIEGKDGNKEFFVFLRKSDPTNTRTI